MTRKFADYPEGAQRLMLATERLVADRGPEGVSVSEIQRVAGQANKSAVHHHFGSKDQLIQTIFDLRQAEVDAKRKERIAEAGYPPPGDASALLGLLLLPVVHAYRGAQLEIYARFILRLMLSDPQSPLFVASREPETTNDLTDRLRACFPNLPEEIFRFREALAIGQFLQGLVQRERLVSTMKTGYATSPRFWDEVLQSAVSVMAQPFPPLHRQQWAVDETQASAPVAEPAKQPKSSRTR